MAKLFASSLFCAIFVINGFTVAQVGGLCNGVPSTNWSCCTDANPCSNGGGDCDRDSHCKGELKCGRNNCRKDFTSDGSNWGRGADCCYSDHVAEAAVPKYECKVDVGFVVDSSGSIGSSNWHKVQALVNKVTNLISMSLEWGHAAVTIFSSPSSNHPAAELKIRFDEYYTYSNPGGPVDSFKEAVENIAYWGGSTMIEEGLRIARDEMFQVSNGMRSDVSKTLILITDGRQNNVDYSFWATEFSNRNIKVIVIGVGNVNVIDLQQLVEDPNDLHLANDFDITLDENFIKNISLCNDDCYSCSPWYNIDNNLSDGDTEVVSDSYAGIPSSAIKCPTAYMIQGKVDGTVIYSGEQALAINGNQVQFVYKYPPSAGTGLTCTSCISTTCRPCSDYSVRFCCLKNNTESEIATTTTTTTPTTTKRPNCPCGTVCRMPNNGKGMCQKDNLTCALVSPICSSGNCFPNGNRIPCFSSITTTNQVTCERAKCCWDKKKNIKSPYWCFRKNNIVPTRIPTDTNHRPARLLSDDNE